MWRTAFVVVGAVVLAQMFERRRPHDIVIVFEAPTVEPHVPAKPQRQPRPQPQPQPQSRPQPQQPQLQLRMADRLGPCPAPYRRGTDADLTLPAIDGTALDITGMTASAYDVRLLAVWDDEHVMLSVDEGRSWQRVLQGDGAKVHDALFDCHGRLHVLRGDGNVGTYDDGDEIERWKRATSFPPNGNGRLVPDGNAVAVVGPDLAFPDRLVIARQDARGRWRSQPLFRDTEYSSWDGIDVVAIAPTANKYRFRMLVMPWQDGECGYSRYIDITFDLDGSHVKITQLGEELPESSRWNQPWPVRDAAGRRFHFELEPTGKHRFERMPAPTRPLR